MTVRGYQAGIGWSGGPDFTGVLEDVSSYVTKQEAVVASWGRSDPWTSSDTATGKLDFTLLNNSRQFSPENGGSPIFSLPHTGVPVRFTDGGTGIFTGELNAYEVATSRAEKTFAVSASDGWGRLGATQLSTAVYQGMRTGDLIGVILDAVGWPAAARDLDSGATLVPYWWAEGQDAKTAVDDLVASEGLPAIAYVRNGLFTFRDRHHRLTRTASLVSQGTYTQKTPAGAIGTDFKILKDTFVYNDGVDRIINNATLQVTPRFPSPESVVWSTTDPIVLASTEVRQFIIQANDPCILLQVPSPTFPYIVDDAATLDYVLDSGTISFTLSRTSGQSAILTATAGGGGAQISTGLRLRGTALTQGSTQQFTAIDAISQAKYEINQWPDPSAPWAYFYDAQAIVDQMVSTYAYPAPTVQFQIEGRLSAGTHARIIATDVGDRITVVNDEMGMNDDFHIEQVTHTVQQLGVRHIQTVGAQAAPQVQATNPFQFDVAGHGFDQGQFTAFAGNNPSTMFRFDAAGVGFDQGVFAS